MAYTANIDVITSNWANSLPKTYDYLRPNAFKFSIKDMPHVSYTCQSANIPAINMGFAQQPTPFIDLPRIGDKVSLGDFTIRFIISEDMSNYLELYTWLLAIGFPKDYTQFSKYVQTKPSSFPFVKDRQNNTEVLAYSDATLTILDSTNNPKVNIIFKDLFPISLEALDFDVATQQYNYFTAISSFKYTLFDVEVL